MEVSLLIREFLALALVFLLFCAAYWFLKKRQLIPQGGEVSQLRLVQCLHVGTKEKIFVLCAGGDQYVVVGCTPAGMRTLHVFGSGVTEDTRMGDARQEFFTFMQDSQANTNR